MTQTDDKLRALAQSAEERPAFIRAGDFLAESDDDDLEYVWHGLPVGGTAILCGRPKAGKTTEALNFALCVARGELFLGRETRKGPVLYVALEGARGGWKSILRKLGVTEADDFFICVGRAPEQALTWLHAAIQEHAPTLVVVDTVQRLLRVKDGNDYAATSNSFDAVIELARLTGAALLLLHHSGRTKHEQIVDEVMGSTAWAGAVDTVFLLRRTHRYRTIESEQRFGENLPETILTMDPDTGRLSATESRATAELRAAQQSILDNLREPARRESLAKLSGHRLFVGRDAADALIRDGVLRRVGGSGKRGDPELYYTDERDEAMPVSSSSSSRTLEDERDEPTTEIGAPEMLRPNGGTRMDKPDASDEVDARDKRDEETRGLLDYANHALSAPRKQPGGWW